MRDLIVAVLVPLCAWTSTCLAADAPPALGPPADVVFSGKVVDAQTGDPVEKFTIQEGWAIGKDQRIGWGSTESSSRNPDGAFKITRQWPTGQKVWVRIIADGYVAQPVTPEPLTSPSTATGLIVRLTRGNTVTARVLNHKGEPVEKASAFLVGTRQLELVDGKPDERFPSGGTRASTDKEGRFTLTGAAAENDRIVVVTAEGLAAVSPVAQGVAGADVEFVIRLPEPATLTIRYDIPGAPDEGKIWLQLKTWDMPEWKGVGTITRKPLIANGRELVVTDLAPGVYDFARTKDLRTGDSGRGVFCDRRGITLEAGKAVAADFVRKAGQPIISEVVGLKEAGLPGAFIYVKSPQATGNPRATDEWKLPIYDALTCDAEGKFKTETISPGEYAVIAEAYAPEPAGGPFRTGLRLPSFIGRANLIVPAADELPLVRIELKPLR
jgi:hypothetical protein